MIAYCNMTANWGNPKKRPPSIDKYMKLEEGESLEDEFIDERLNVLYKAQEEYRKKVESKNIN